jgi:hypothetical protein
MLAKLLARGTIKRELDADEQINNDIHQDIFDFGPLRWRQINKINGWSLDPDVGISSMAILFFHLH